MEKLEKFSFQKDDGTVVEASVIGCFTIKELNKTFLLYNTRKDDTVDASLVVDKGNVIELQNISEADKYAVEKLIDTFASEGDVK